MTGITSAGAIAGAMLAVATLAAPLTAAQAQDAKALATRIVELQSPAAAVKAQLDTEMKALREGQGIRRRMAQSPAYQAAASRNEPKFNAAIARMGTIEADAVEPVMRDMQAANRQLRINSYVERFAVAELQEILKFLQSPTGRKLTGAQTQINADVARKLQAEFGPKVQAAQRTAGPKIQAELEKLFPQQQGQKK